MPWHFHETFRPIAASELFMLRGWRDVCEALWERQYAMRESNLTAYPTLGCILNRMDPSGHATNSNPFPTDVPASPAESSGSDPHVSLRYIQEWCENNRTNFVGTVDEYGGISAPSLPTWRRCTQTPFEYDQTGLIEAGDIIGPWLFYDIQTALNALTRWAIPANALDLYGTRTRSCNGYSGAGYTAQENARNNWNSGWNVYEWNEGNYDTAYCDFWFEVNDGYDWPSNNYYTWTSAGVFCQMVRLTCSIPSAQQMGKVCLYIHPQPFQYYGNRNLNGGMLTSDPSYWTDVFFGFPTKTLADFSGNGWGVLDNVEMVDMPPSTEQLYQTQDMGWQFTRYDTLMVMDASANDAPETGFAYTDRYIDTSAW